MINLSNCNSKILVLLCWNKYKNGTYNLISGISSGEGPDILVFSPGEYSELKGLIQEDMLCDLSELIKKDKSFKLSDYNEKLMDCGVINDKMIEDELQQYLNDKESAEQAAKALDTKVTLFMNE